MGHRHTGLMAIKSSSMVFMELIRDMGMRVSRACGYVFRVICKRVGNTTSIQPKCI